MHAVAALTTTRDAADRPVPPGYPHGLRRQAAISGVAPPRRTGTSSTLSSSLLGPGGLAPQRGHVGILLGALNAR